MGAFVRVRLPFFRDHCVLDSIDGVLLLQRDHDTAIRPLKASTRSLVTSLKTHVSPNLLGDEWFYMPLSK